MLPTKRLLKHPLSSTLSKIKNSLSLSGKNPSFLANTFSTSQIIDEVKKVKLLSCKGFSLSYRVVKKMDKVELREEFRIQNPGIRITLPGGLELSNDSN